MQLLAYILIFASISLVLFVLGQRLRKPKPETDPFEILKPDAFGPLNKPLASVFPVSQKKRETLQNELLGAGRFHSNALTNYLAQRNVCVMMVIVATGLVLVSEVFDPAYNKFIIIGGIVACIFAYGLPRLILSSIASTRRSEIENAFPDALDMIAMSVDCLLYTSPSPRD